MRIGDTGLKPSMMSFPALIWSMASDLSLLLSLWHLSVIHTCMLQIPERKRENMEVLPGITWCPSSPHGLCLGPVWDGAQQAWDSQGSWWRVWSDTRWRQTHSYRYRVLICCFSRSSRERRKRHNNPLFLWMNFLSEWDTSEWSCSDEEQVSHVTGPPPPPYEPAVLTVCLFSFRGDTRWHRVSPPTVGSSNPPAQVDRLSLLSLSVSSSVPSERYIRYLCVWSSQFPGHSVCCEQSLHWESPSTPDWSGFSTATVRMRSTRQKKETLWWHVTWCPGRPHVCCSCNKLFWRWRSAGHRQAPPMYVWVGGKWSFVVICCYQVQMLMNY